MKIIFRSLVTMLILFLGWGELQAQYFGDFSYDKCNNQVKFKMQISSHYHGVGACSGSSYADEYHNGKIDIVVNGSTHKRIFDLSWGTGHGHKTGWQAVHVSGDANRTVYFKKASGISASISSSYNSEGGIYCGLLHTYGNKRQYYVVVTINLPPDVTGEGQNIRAYFDGHWDSGTGNYKSWQSSQVQTPDIPRVATPLALERLCDGVELTWGKPSFSCNNSSYAILRDGVEMEVVNFNTLAWVDNTVTFDDVQDHKYEVLVRLNSNVKDNGLSTSVDGNPIRNFDSSDYFESVSLSASNFCSQTVRLQWAIDDKVDIDYFEVERDVTDQFLEPIVNTVTQTFGTISFDDMNVPVNQDFYYRIKAYDNCANETYIDNADIQHIMFEGPPSSPSITKINPATDGTDHATISWDYPPDGTPVDYFQVYRREEGGSGSARSNKLDPDISTFEDNGLNNCFEYEYWVVAGKECFDESNSMRVQQVISFNTDLNGFDQLTASKYYFNDRISVNWKVSDGNQASEIIVYRKREGSQDNPEIIKRLNVNSSSFIDYDTEPGVLYQYGLLAISCPDYRPSESEVNNMMSDVGVRSETGIINGKVTFEGGNAVEGVRVLATPSDGENRGVSVEMTGNKLVIPLEKEEENWFPDEWTFSFWFRMHDKSSGQSIFNVADGLDFLRITPLAGGTTSFDNIKYSEQTSIVGVEDELVGFITPSNEIVSLKDKTALGKIDETPAGDQFFIEYKKEEISALSSGDTLYRFQSKEPWMVKQGDQWFELSKQSTSLVMPDSLFGYLRGDTIYEAINSDFALAFIQESNDQLYLANHYNISYELGEQYATIKGNQMIFADDVGTYGDVVDDIVYSTDGSAMHMIRGNNVYYVYRDELNQKLVRGRRFARKLPNTTDPEVSFDIFVLERTVTESITRGENLGIVETNRTKVFEIDGIGRTNFLIDAGGIVRTADYRDTVMYVPDTAPLFDVTGFALTAIDSGKEEYLFNNTRDSLYNISLRQGLVDDMDFVTDETTGEFIFYLGETIDGERQVYQAVGEQLVEIVSNIESTYSKEAYQAQLEVMGGDLSSTEQMLSPELYLGEFNNVLVSYNGSELIYYINGNSIDTVQVSGLSNVFKKNGQELVFGGYAGIQDETLLWSVAKDSAAVKQDFNRYLSGGQDNLIGYWRIDEKVSTNSFDASYAMDNSGKKTFNGHHATLDAPLWANVVPEQEDLSFTSFTDVEGNYSIQSIIYSGSGNNFKVVPILGSHKFEPANKILFIGPSQQVQNEKDFSDKSAFRVTGTVKYDPRILGEFESVDDPNAPNCYVEGVRIYIDDQPIIKDGTFYTTDKFGRFDIDVPIGKHTIKVERDKHTFSESVWPPVGQYNFQNEVPDLVFYDNTTRTLIGKVVGGSTEGKKISGEGLSVNNIGVAHIKLRSIGKTCYEKVIKTDPVTGEYKIDLPPFRYNIVDISIPSQTTNFNRELRKLAEASIDLSKDNLAEQEVTCRDNCQVQNELIEYYLAKDFVYRETPKINVLSATNTDPDYLGDEVYSDTYRDLSIEVQSLPFDVYTTESSIIWNIFITEDYYNWDNDPSVPKFYPDTIRNEKIFIDNDISGIYESYDLANGSIRYSFVPSESSLLYDRLIPEKSFTKTVQIRTESGKTWRGKDNIYKGYVFGGASDSNERSFYTVSDTGQDYQVVDFILRDPPGSQSYAKLADKSKITKVRKTSYGDGVVHESSSVFGSKFKMDAETPVTSWNIFKSETYAGLKFKTNQSKEGTETSVISFKKYLEFSTSGENKNTGAGSDLFIGNGINIFINPIYQTKLLPVDTCASKNMECFYDVNFEIEGVDYTVGRQRVIGAGMDERDTYFYYTQRQIEQLIDDLDRDFGLVDTTTISGKVTASRLKNQSRIWKSAIAQNEYEKLLAKQHVDNGSANSATSVENISFAYGSNIDRDYKIGVDNTFESSKSFSFYSGFTMHLEFAIASVYTKVNLDVGISAFASEADIAEEGRQQEVHIAFRDNDPGDQYSVDVVLNNYPSDLSFGNELAKVYDLYGAELLSGLPSAILGFEDVDNEFTYTHSDKSNFINPIYITRGGRTSCPYEPEERAKYLEYLKPEWLADLKSKGIILDYSSDPEESNRYIIEEKPSEDYILNYGTFKRDQPGFRIEPRVQSGIPWDGLKRAKFDVIFENLNVEDTVRTYQLVVDQRTTGAGPTMRLDGERFIKGTDIALYGGEQLTKSITIRPVVDVYDYEDIVIYLVASCQFDFGQDLDFQEDIYARDTLSVYFDPVCPQATVISPTENWIINNQTGAELQVEIQEQEYYFQNHDKIKLQFKAAYQSDDYWSDIAVWSRDTQEVMDQIALGENYFDFPLDNNYIVYDWHTDDYAPPLPDGDYQIRWHYHCINGLESFSVPINGVIDQTGPHAFGRPTPADGVLSPDDEIILTLNEPIEAGLVDRDFISVKGKLNGTELLHAVSVRFSDSESDQVVIPNIELKGVPITVEMWIRRDEEFASREQEIFHHSEPGGTALSLRILADGKLQLSLNDQVVQSGHAIPFDTWSQIAFSFDPSENKAALYHKSTLIGFDEAFVAMHYATTPIVLGGEGSLSFTGNIHELRLWSKYMTAGDLVENSYKDLSGREMGLIGYWPMNEGKSDLSLEKVQARHAQINAGWSAEPSSLSFDFTGSNEIELPSLAFENDEDFTIEFWFKAIGTSTIDTMTLVSNGNIPGLDWNIVINTLGQVVLLHNDQRFVLVGEKVLDEKWHHMALVVNRISQATAYLDNNVASVHPAASFIGFGGPGVTLGARLTYDANIKKPFDQRFIGQMDEFRVWRMAKQAEQIDRMAGYKFAGDEFGLVCYLPFEDYDEVYRISKGTLSCLGEYDEGTVGVSNEASYSAENPNIILKPYETPVLFNYSVSEDKIIITLEENDPARIENCILDISVRRLIDKRGNVMKSPVTWSVFVDRNQVTWQEPTVVLNKRLNESLVFSSKIQNVGGDIQSFTIDNLPPWLTAEPSSGTINPDSEQEIFFTINDGLNIGSYQQPIHLRTDFGFNEALLLNLKVYQELPEGWTFNPENFQYTMSFIGQIKIHDNYSIDVEDRVGAFVDGEMRGFASLVYQEVYDNYQVFLSVYSNTTSNETLEFRVWDANKGKVLSNIVIPEINQNSILFVPDEIYGRPSSPVTFESKNNILSIIEIPSGWKWVSFNLDSDDLLRTRNLFEGQEMSDGDRLISLDALDIYDAQNDLWIGSVAGDNLPAGVGAIDVKQAYRIFSANPVQIQYIGNPVQPLNTSIPVFSSTSAIKPTRWNWVSFLGQENMDINEALSSLQPEDGDIIKSQYAFAIYDPVLKWTGNLKFLSPGQGYLIRVGKDQVLTFPQSGLINASFRTNQVNSLYKRNSFDPHIYRDNMNLVVRVVGLDINIKAPTLEVYHNDELRGVAEIKDVNGEQLYYLTAFGDSDEELNYKIKFDDYTYPLEEKNSFESAQVIGSQNDPVVMSYIHKENINLGLQVFPNPFSNNVKFVFELDEQGYTSLRLFALDGRILLDREFIGDRQEVIEFNWTGVDDFGRELMPGTYIVKFQSFNLEKGQLLIKK